MAGFTPDWLFLVSVYIIVSIINIYGAFLYHKACVQMHRTIMIKSVFYLLGALVIENVYFLILAIAGGFDLPIAIIMMHPVLWSIPKLILGGSLLFFVAASLSPTRQLKKDCKTLDSACSKKK